MPSKNRTAQDWRVLAVKTFEEAEAMEQYQPLAAAEAYAKASAAAAIATAIGRPQKHSATVRNPA